MSKMSEAKIVILVGENRFAIGDELRKRISEFVDKHGDLALEKIDVAENPEQNILSAVETPPFLSPKKMCVIYNLSANTDAQNLFEQILGSGSADTEIILVEGKLDKRSAYYKTLKKQTGFKEFAEPDEQQSISWLVDEAKSQDGSLSRSDAQYLYSRVGPSQSRLSNELKKLLNYNKDITRPAIDELTEPKPSSTIFDLMSAAFSGNSKKAIKLYDEQRLQKVEPQQIIGMIGWQMHVVAMVDSAGDISSDDLARQASINPYVIKKTRQIVSRLDKNKIRKILDDLAVTDYAIKNKSIDADEAMKNLIVLISG